MKKPYSPVPLLARLQRGQALVEYAVIAAALVGALFVAEFNGKTGAQHLADMIKAAFYNLTYLLSLP